MSLAGLSLETATRRGGVDFGDEVVAVLMRAVTVARLVRRVVVRVGVEGRIGVAMMLVACPLWEVYVSVVCGDG